MIAMTSDTGLVLTWIAFAVLVLSWVVAVVIWGVRSKQFTNQKRARYLALWSGIPGGEAPEPTRSKPGEEEAKKDVQP